MWVTPAVEEDQMARMRSDNRAVPVYRLDVRRGRVVREDELAARPWWVIGAEK